MHDEITANRNTAYKLLGSELLVTVAIALFLFLIESVIAAYSALLGGLAYLIPNFWFIRRVFDNSGQMTPQRILSRFYIGETGKLVINAILFALCFLLVKPLHVGALFLTFGIMLVMNIAGLAAISSRADKRKNNI